MKNVNTDVIFFSNVDIPAASQGKTMTIHGVNRGIPEIPAIRINDDLLRIQTLSFMVSINALEYKDLPHDDPDNVICFAEAYEVRFRLTEPSSGRFMDLDTITFVPEEEQVVLCSKTYTKRILCQYQNVSVARPPAGKNRCLLKVLIRHRGAEDKKWFVQSVHPIEIR